MQQPPGTFDCVRLELAQVVDPISLSLSDERNRANPSRNHSKICREISSTNIFGTLFIGFAPFGLNWQIESAHGLTSPQIELLECLNLERIASLDRLDQLCV
jgi:hypothetical protein